MAVTTSIRLSCTLFDLSTELLIEILSYLPAMDLVSVQSTCHTIRDIVTGTAYLQYTLSTHTNRVNDFLPPDFPYSERLKLLRRHEQSRKALQFNLFTKCVLSLPCPPQFTLQDGYLMYECPAMTLPISMSRYGYIDLCSVAQNEDSDARWVNITIDNSHLPFPWRVILTFAVDHDLVVAIREQQDDGATRVHLSFFEFTTGAPHPLSSTHTVSLPPVPGLRYAYKGAEVLGDYVMVLVRDPIKEVKFYLVSWKTGTVVLISDTLQVTGLRYERLKTLIIENSVFLLIEGSANSLVVCKIEITPPIPCLWMVCSLGSPPLTSGVSVILSEVLTEWVPTSKDYPRSRSTRRRQVPFYSSTVGTVALVFVYRVPWKRFLYKYTMVIKTEALLSVIRSGLRDVPWVDWGPSSAQLFEGTMRTAGPSWITSLSPLAIRECGFMQMRYAASESTAEDTSSSQFLPPIFSTILFGSHWEGNNVETHLLYREVVANDLHFDQFGQVMADREWLVGIVHVEAGTSVTVYHLR